MQGHLWMALQWRGHLWDGMEFNFLRDGAHSKLQNYSELHCSKNIVLFHHINMMQ
jgi:hypothetical protein